MPSTEIILTDNVPGLGAEADIVKVRRGYARNYLLPHGKAHEVTPASLRQLENLKKKRAEREARELNEAEELARRINKLRVTFKLETGETGKAFGSITAQDIVTRLKNEIGDEIERFAAQDQVIPRTEGAAYPDVGPITPWLPCVHRLPPQWMLHTNLLQFPLETTRNPGASG